MKLVGNFTEIAKIDKVFPGNQIHAPCGLQLQGKKQFFATALEVHYPKQLRDVIANTIALALHKRNIIPAVPLSLNQTARAFSHVQAGTAKVPTVLPEYSSKVVSMWHQQLQIWPQQRFSGDDCKLLYDIRCGGREHTTLVQRGA